MTNLQTLRASAISDRVQYSTPMAIRIPEHAGVDIILRIIQTALDGNLKLQVVLVLTSKSRQDTERFPTFLGGALGYGCHASATATA